MPIFRQSGARDQTRESAAGLLVPHPKGRHRIFDGDIVDNPQWYFFMIFCYRLIHI